MSTNEENNRGPHPFDQLMFGPRNQFSQQIPTNEEQQEGEVRADEEQSFDLFGTAQTAVETYKQLSPYVKGISGMFKKFKA